MRTSFHHQPEAQHQISSYQHAGRPITPSFHPIATRKRTQFFVGSVPFASDALQKKRPPTAAVLPITSWALEISVGVDSRSLNTGLALLYDRRDRVALFGQADCSSATAPSVYFPYCCPALAIDGPAVARSCGFMTGRKETFALNARNHGSATAGICDESFMSNTMEPDRLPLSSAKK